MPFFSIVITAYNRADLIEQTLRSILDQDFTDFEIVIVDDGSTEPVKQAVDPFTSAHPNVRYLYQPNSERGSARNNGIRHAGGEYVVLFDSDDLMHSNHLKTLHAFIRELQEPDFIATQFDFFANGKNRTSDIMRLAAGWHDYRLLLHGNVFACNICFRRKLPSLLLFEEDRRYAMLEDWMFLIQNLRHSKIYLIGKVTVSMRDHDRRSMNADSLALVKKAGLFYDWIVKYVSLSDPEQRILKAQIHYFSAIHCYLANNRSAVISQLRQAISANGFRVRYVALFLKCIPGHALLSQFKF